MDELGPLAIAPERRPPRGSKHAVRISDGKTQQEVLLHGAEPIRAFALDDENRPWWAEGDSHPDAVALITHADDVVVVFIELTQSVRPRRKGRAAEPIDPIPRKLEQLEGGMMHFHPTGLTGGRPGHGDDHHRAWSAGADPLDVVPSRDHRVAGIVLGFHHGPRTIAGPTTIGGLRVPRAVWSPVPSSRGRAEVGVPELLHVLGWRV